MQRKNLMLEGVVTLKSSLSHIGDSIGNQSLLRREKVIQDDMSIVDVVVYSGNALRGALRDCGFLYFVKKMGVEQINLEGFYLLASGGVLSSGSGLDLAQARKLRKLMPMLSVFGGAVGNQIMEGKMVVGKLYPLAKECERQIPEKFRPLIKSSYRPWLQEEEYSRKDDAKNENMRALIASDGEKRSKENPQQMRYSVETLAAGAKFYSQIMLHDCLDVEIGAFLSCLEKFSEYPSLGGKRGTGHGLCDLDYGKVVVGDNIKYDEEMQSCKDKYDEYLRVYQQALMDGKDASQEVLGIETFENSSKTF